MGSYIPEDDILRSHRRENPKSCSLVSFCVAIASEYSSPDFRYEVKPRPVVGLLLTGKNTH
jgi:hypothetical protein